MDFSAGSIHSHKYYFSSLKFCDLRDRKYFADLVTREKNVDSLTNRTGTYNQRQFDNEHEFELAMGEEENIRGEVFDSQSNTGF